jgi:hypothetical protein
MIIATKVLLAHSMNPLAQRALVIPRDHLNRKVLGSAIVDHRLQASFPFLVGFNRRAKVESRCLFLQGVRHWWRSRGLLALILGGSPEKIDHPRSETHICFSSSV